MHKSKLKMRSEIIEYIYSHLVLEKKLSSTTAFESGNFLPSQVKIIDHISINFDKYKITVEQFLKHNWLWERIDYLEQAILIYGTYELEFQDKALVINELVDITKAYIPGHKYKFINAILEKVGTLYANQN